MCSTTRHSNVALRALPPSRVVRTVLLVTSAPCLRGESLRTLVPLTFEVSRVMLCHVLCPTARIRAQQRDRQRSLSVDVNRISHCGATIPLPGHNDTRRHKYTLQLFQSHSIVVDRCRNNQEPRLLCEARGAWPVDFVIYTPYRSRACRTRTPRSVWIFNPSADRNRIETERGQRGIKHADRARSAHTSATHVETTPGSCERISYSYCPWCTGEPSLVASIFVTRGSH